MKNWVDRLDARLDAIGANLAKKEVPHGPGRRNFILPLCDCYPVGHAAAGHNLGKGYHQRTDVPQAADDRHDGLLCAADRKRAL